MDSNARRNNHSYPRRYSGCPGRSTPTTATAAHSPPVAAQTVDPHPRREDIRLPPLGVEGVLVDNIPRRALIQLRLPVLAGWVLPRRCSLSHFGRRIAVGAPSVVLDRIVRVTPVLTLDHHVESQSECSVTKLATNSSSDGRRDGEYTISIWESRAASTRNRMPISAVALPFSTCEIHRRETLALAASSACVSPRERRSPRSTAPRSVGLQIWGWRLAGADGPSGALTPPVYQNVPVRLHRLGAPGRIHRRPAEATPSSASEHVDTHPSTM